MAWMRAKAHSSLLPCLAVFASLVLGSCATDPELPPEVPVEDQGPSPVDPPFPQSSDLLGGFVLGETIPPQVAPVVTEPRFQASKELFDQTFAEIKALVVELNDLIRRKDYERWQSYLSAEYISRTSSPEVLAEQSESAILKSRNIVLRTLQDYFDHVVVPSRANVRIDDIVFVNATEVEAIMLFPGSRRVMVYRLVKQGDDWLIGP